MKLARYESIGVETFDGHVAGIVAEGAGGGSGEEVRCRLRLGSKVVSELGGN